MLQLLCKQLQTLFWGIKRGEGNVGEKKEIKTICAYCGTGCGLVLEVEDDRIVRSRGDKDAPVNQGQTCIKGAFGYNYIHSEDRLTAPLIRDEETQKLVPTTWEKALSIVAEKFSDIKNAYGGNAISIFACARATNETNYVTQKFARAVLGSNNIDGCNRT